jgi:type IV pilus assembly protein PilV
MIRISVRPYSSSRPQRGISMVEALVALVVMSVGMLGIAGLSVASLRGNRTALVRTEAVNFVSDMSDRIRANGSARDAYGLAAANGNCTTANCTAIQLAQDDLFRWRQAITAAGTGLPGTNVSGTVIYTAAAAAGLPDQYTISVQWTEPGDTIQPGQTNASSYTSNLLLIPAGP